MKVLIIQSHDGWLRLCKMWINNSLPHYHVGNVTYTNSFDHAIDLMKEKKFSLIITSAIFHDAKSEHRDTATRTIPDIQKKPNTLAGIVKKTNPETKVYVLSNQKKEEYETSLIKGWISKKVNPKHEIIGLVNTAVR